MTTPTKEQCVQWARECGGHAYTENLTSNPVQVRRSVTMRDDQLHAFALKVLAEKELEVLKLREAFEKYDAAHAPDAGCKNCHGTGEWRPDRLHPNDSDETCYCITRKVEVADDDLKSALREALSTPPSTEALDEYIAVRMAESEDRRDAERLHKLLKHSFINGGSAGIHFEFERSFTSDGTLGDSVIAAIDALPAIDAEKGRG